jgi:hypothetical protein
MNARREDEQIQFGPIPYCEHFGPWKASSQDTDVTHREYDEVYDVLRSWLEDYWRIT